MWRHSLATPARLRTAPWNLHNNRADADRSDRCRHRFSADLSPTVNDCFWHITSIAAPQHFGRFWSKAEIDSQSGFISTRRAGRYNGPQANEALSVPS